MNVDNKIVSCLALEMQDVQRINITAHDFFALLGSANTGSLKTTLCGS